MDVEIKDLLQKVGSILNQPELLFSLVMASLTVIARTAASREPLILPIVNLLTSGVFVPIFIWVAWHDTPYVVYGFISTVSALLLGSLLRKALEKLKRRFNTHTEDDLK